MNILVFGAGAIGSVLGGFLAQAGHEVTLLGRAWHLDAIRAHGLRLSGLWGEHHITRLAAATRLDELHRPLAYDWVFVCVKAHQTAEAAKMLPSVLGPQTLVCAFQNGLGNDEALTRVIAPERVALARVIFGAEIEPGHVRVTVCADDVLIGAPEARVPPERVARLASTLRDSGIPTRATSAILPALWAKALYNCALNGLSALLEAPYGALLTHPMAPRLMRAVIEEAYAVAGAHGVSLDPTTPAGYAELLFGHLIPQTGAHRSSMLRDVRCGKPTEIDAMNGAVARLGRQRGIPTPTNTLITRLVHAQERFCGCVDSVAAVC